MKRNVLSYESGHPNPLFYRPTWMSLSGPWPFCFDDENRGLREGWSNKIPEGVSSIRVPYAYETPSSGVQDDKEHTVIWYFKTFLKPHWSGKCLLHFERCDYVFDGWVNGHYLGKHVGGYDAFRFDIGDYLNEGDNLLSIRVFDDSDPTHVRGKQTWKEKPFGCFYPRTTGLYGDVWLEEVPKASLQGYDARGSYEDKMIYFRLLFTPEAIGEQFSLRLSYKSHLVSSLNILVNAIYMEDSLAIPKKDLHGWSPAFPCLYDLEMTLERNGERTDRVLSYVGINEIRQKKNTVTLNGKKRFFKGVLYQGDNPKGGMTFTEEEYLRDIRLIKSMGFNGVRVHEKVESELFYYLADREGLLTTLELPSSHLYDPVEASEASDQWGRIVTDHVGHPSIIAYVAYNESRGIDNIALSEEMQKQATSLYDMSNRIDWSRPALSNDGWEHTSSDILSLHADAKDGKELLQNFAGLKTCLEEGKNFEVIKGKTAFVGGYHYLGQPCVLSEFFSATFKKDQRKAWGHPFLVFSPREYLKRYRSLLKAAKKLGFCGYCATQFADAYQEKNGFVDESRRPKVSVEALRRANKSF